MTAGASACGGKRKVGPESTERGKSESPRKAALSGTASSGTASVGENPLDGGSPRAEAEAEALLRPQVEKGTKSDGADATAKSAEGGGDRGK